MLPPLIFEDEHLLVVNKPAGLNTHAPAPYAGEGIYEWLRDREPRWSDLAIIHRLDKETSGVMVFSKSKKANRDLTRQFEGRQVSKKYVFLTVGRAASTEFTVKSCLVRAGERYVVRPLHATGLAAETVFRCLEDVVHFTAAETARRDGTGRVEQSAAHLWEAEPKTGRTHQIRAHSAERGIPILGDVLYGGEPAARVYLHAAEITFRHPTTDETVTFKADPQFEADPRLQLRRALIDAGKTDCYRIVHGAADGKPAWYIDRLGGYLLSQRENELTHEQTRYLEELLNTQQCHAVYHKILSSEQRQRTSAEAQPKFLMGEPAPNRFVVRENGLQFELSFQEGYSVGMFLDQRDNRRRVLTEHIGADFPLYSENGATKEVLNAFSYTCAFSMCAAKPGAHVTSLDLSKKYLDWGKRNFARNELKPEEHDFIYGDVFDWLPRLAKKGRRFDLVLLDPPTFSRSRHSGVFRAEKDFGKLIQIAAPLVKANGVLFCSCNTATWEPAEFLNTVRAAITSSKRKLLQEKYCPQPPDFPISRDEPGYLKTVWLRLD